MTRFAGVMGWPVAHSRSPLLHNAWIAGADIDGRYEAFAVRPEATNAAIMGAAALGFAGLNVTLPHKEASLALAEEATEAARRVGAANVLTFQSDGPIVADNTDVVGFAAGLPAEPIADMAVRILGAGGAARAAAAALVDKGVGRIDIVNRSQARGTALAQDIQGWGGEARWIPWSGRDDGLAGIGLLVNATHLGMTGQPPLAMDLATLPDDAIVYDIVYTPLITPLLGQARARGLRIVDGLTMFIAQAEPSFRAFFGQDPPASVDARRLLLGGQGSDP